MYIIWLLPGEDTIRTLPLRDYAVESNRVELLVPSIFWSEVACDKPVPLSACVLF